MRNDVKRRKRAGKKSSVESRTFFEGLSLNITILGELDLKWYKATRKLEKNYLRILTGFFTGHSRLKGLNKFGIKENGLCTFCDKKDWHWTTGHVPQKEGMPQPLLPYSDRELNNVKPLAVFNFIKKKVLDVVL